MRKTRVMKSIKRIDLKKVFIIEIIFGLQREYVVLQDLV